MELWLAYFLGLRSSIFIYLHIAIFLFILTGEGLAAIRKGVPPPEPSAIHKVPHSRLRTHPQLHSLFGHLHLFGGGALIAINGKETEHSLQSGRSSHLLPSDGEHPSRQPSFHASEGMHYNKHPI